MLYRSAQKHDVRDAAQSAGVVTMGINPSKHTLHLGHYATLFNAHSALASASHAVGMFFVDDREHHSKMSQDRINGDRFTMSKPVVVESVQKLIAGFLTSLDEQLKTNVAKRTRIVPMHEYMTEGSANTQLTIGAQLYNLLWQQRTRIVEAFNFDSAFNEAPFVIPLCKDCNAGSRTPELIISTEHGVRSQCIDTLCMNSQKVIEATPSEGDTNWSMHYTVDPIRDALVSRQFLGRKVLHVFGGDYGMPWGRGGLSKADRLDTTLDHIAPGKVDYFVGPLLRRNGEKLAKSNGDKIHKVPKAPALRELATAGAIVDL